MGSSQLINEITALDVHPESLVDNSPQPVQRQEADEFNEIVIDYAEIVGPEGLRDLDLEKA